MFNYTIPMNAGTPTSAFITALLTDSDYVRRRVAYDNYWRYYSGSHTSFIPWQRNKIRSINYTKAITDLHINFLMQNGFSIVIPDIPGTTQDESSNRLFVKNLLDETWRKNEKLKWCFNYRQMGGVTGDVYLYHSWCEDSPVYKKPYVKVDILPSKYCYPILGGPDGRDALDVQAMVLLFPIYRNTREFDAFTRSQNPFSQIHNFSKNLLNIYYKVEIWTRDKVVRFSELDSTTTEEVNPFGEIPIVHVANYPVAGEYYGLSDLSDIIDVQKEYNFKCSDVSRIIEYCSSPRIAIFGQKPTQLDNDPSSAWFFDDPEGKGSIKVLEMTGNSMAVDYINRLHRSMHEITYTPSNALGQAEGGSNAESAAAQATRYQPMIMKRQIGVQLYGEGIRNSNRLILKINALKDAEFGRKFSALPEEDRYMTDVVFEDPFPRNKDLEIARSEKLLKIGLTTKQRELTKMGHGEADAADIIRVSEEERKREKELEALGKEPSGNPNPVQQNSNVQGERHSLTVEKNATA